jgi:GH18 family chitinase
MRSHLFLCLVLALVLVAGCRKKDMPSPGPTPTAPGCGSLVSPAANAFVTSTSVTLNWSSVLQASTYDVMLGTSPGNAVALATGVTGNSHTITIAPTPNVTYFWYVIPRNSSGAATGCSAAARSFTFISIQLPPSLGYYVVGYFPSYRPLADVPDVKFKMTNVVVYAFYQVNSTGSLAPPTSNTASLSAVAAKAKANNAKIFLGINDGSGNGTTNFKNMAASPSGRTSFIRDIMTIVRAQQLDGVDMDWEFPSTSDGTDVTFTALMKELADSLHRDGRYYLSCAITAGKYAGGYRDAIRNELFPVVDFFNIMAYDDFSTTVPFRHHSDFALAQTCLQYWITTRGLPAAKAVLGVPSYGRPSGITQSNTVLSYRNILSQGGNAQLDSAVVSSGSFTNYTIYYNGQFTVKRKAKLAKDIAGGVMFWEKWQDAPDANSLLKAACDTVGRTY